MTNAYTAKREWPGVTLYHADCLDLLPAIEADSVDMIWTDPPYGHGNHDGDLNARLNDHRGLEQKPIYNDQPDEMRRVVDGMLTEAARILKLDRCCCCCCCCGGGGPKPTFAWVADRLDRSGLAFFHSVIWDKINPGLGWRFRRQHEMVMVAHRSGGKLAWNESEQPMPNVLRLSKPRGDLHPNIKPVELVEEFVKKHVPTGANVLDPFMGSGTTGIACIRTGRKFIGIEKDARYFQIACDRIECELAQGKLFNPAEIIQPKQLAFA